MERTREELPSPTNKEEDISPAAESPVVQFLCFSFNSPLLFLYFLAFYIQLFIPQTTTTTLFSKPLKIDNNHRSDVSP